MTGMLDSLGEIRFRTIAVVGVVLGFVMAGMWWFSGPVEESSGQVEVPLSVGSIPEEGGSDVPGSELSDNRADGGTPIAESLPAEQLLMNDGKATPAAKPAPAVRRAPASETRKMGGFAVQVGAFSSEAGAMARRNELRSLGFDVYLRLPEKSQKDIFRLLVGHFTSRQQASEVKGQLKLKGVDGFIKRLN